MRILWQSVLTPICRNCSSVTDRRTSTLISSLWNKSTYSSRCMSLSSFKTGSSRPEDDCQRWPEREGGTSGSWLILEEKKLFIHLIHQHKVILRTKQLYCSNRLAKVIKDQYIRLIYAWLISKKSSDRCRTKNIRDYYTALLQSNEHDIGVSCSYWAKEGGLLSPASPGERESKDKPTLYGLSSLSLFSQEGKCSPPPFRPFLFSSD